MLCPGAILVARRVEGVIRAGSRVKVTSVHHKGNLLVCGTSTGGIYVYQREASVRGGRLCRANLLKVLQPVSDRVPVTALRMSTARGTVLAAAWQGGGTDVLVVNVDTEQVLLRTAVHKGAEVTCLQWDPSGQRLFSGDSLGRVGRATWGQPTRDVVELQAFGDPVVQLDEYRRQLLVSTTAGAFCLPNAAGKPPTSAPTQIGTKPRNGLFGACFASGVLHRAFRRAGLLSSGGGGGAGGGTRRDGGSDGEGAAGAGAGAGAGASTASTAPRGRLVFSVRPGRRLWAGLPSGQVLLTLKVPALTSPSVVPCASADQSGYTPLPTVLPKKKGKLKSPSFGQVWRWSVGGRQLLVSQAGTSLLVVEPHPGRLRLCSWVAAGVTVLSPPCQTSSASDGELLALCTGGDGQQSLVSICAVPVEAFLESIKETSSGVKAALRWRLYDSSVCEALSASMAGAVPADIDGEWATYVAACKTFSAHTSAVTDDEGSCDELEPELTATAVAKVGPPSLLRRASTALVSLKSTWARQAAAGGSLSGIGAAKLRAVRTELASAVSPADAAAVIQAHAGVLSNLEVRLTADHTAAKDVMREDVRINGVLLPATSPDRDVLDLLVQLVLPILRELPGSEAAARSLLRCASRTATGGESYFAIHSLMQAVLEKDEVIITPTHHASVVDTPAPLVVNANPSTGTVLIRAENVFDVHRGGIESSPMQPWLTLRAIVTEEGLLGSRGSRVRRLALVLLPEDDDRNH